ncbi:SGNH/GDSL hydrolase family protein, partial [candidate division CSSED10-310 bacterium]
PKPEKFEFFVPDEKLFWKFPAYHEEVNAFGFRGDEIEIPKPIHTYRMIFLGDSCTAQGYPAFVASLLNDRFATQTRRFESVNLSISGYSSYQGRMIAEMYGSQFEPDLVFIYYGWNDHWQAYGAIDAQKKIKQTSWGRMAYKVYHNIRLLQGLKKIINTVKRSNKPLSQVRVSLDQYRQNLQHIKGIFQQHNIPVVFISAPTAHYRCGVPDYLLDQNFIPSKEFSVTMHQKYNSAVRTVAHESNSFLLDLENDFNDSRALEDIFKEDGIHFTDFGLMLIANRIADFVTKNILETQT